MSLVNLAHVCSHLQNASLARLGLTSIPYTKLHLSLALLLQKQGFLSHLKLGGPSPPASLFGQGPRDNHALSNYPHGAAGRNRHSPEAALALVVRERYTQKQLRDAGYGEEAITFAQQHGHRSFQDLERAGWHRQIPRFIADINARVNALSEEREMQYDRQRDEIASLENSDQNIDAFEDRIGRTVEERRQRVLEDVLATLPNEQADIYRTYGHRSHFDLENTTRYDFATLQAIAGPHSYLTEREIRLNGIIVEAMGLPVPNQSITLPISAYQDPAHMETEGVVTQQNRASRRLWLGLKYYESKPVLSQAQMISKPTKRVWLNSRDLGKLVRGKEAGEVKPLAQIGEIMAISTDRGVIEARECVERRIGGMPLCRIW